MSMCEDCPYNGGSPREEEIICRLDRDPRECTLWATVELDHMPPQDPEDWEVYSESDLAYEEGYE